MCRRHNVDHVGPKRPAISPRGVSLIIMFLGGILLYSGMTSMTTPPENCSVTDILLYTIEFSVGLPLFMIGITGCFDPK